MPVTINGNGLIGGLADIKVPDGTASAPTISNIDDLNTGIFFPAEDTIAFSEGGTEVIRINSSGNVGIGTSSPSNPLEIYNATAANFMLRGDGTVTQVVRRASTDANAPIMYLDKARGTTASRTVVASGDTAGQIIFRAFDGSASLPAAQIDAVVDATPGTNDMPGRLVFSTTADGASSPTERMRITSTGNVGIGASPGYRLHVVDSNEGDVIVAALQSTASGAGSSTTRLRLTKGAGGQAYGGEIAGFLTQNVGSGLTFYTVNAGSSTERMRIDYNGNVGIGTSSPATKLHIVDSSTSLIRLQGDSYVGEQIMRYSSDANPAEIALFKTRGTMASGATVANGDGIGVLRFYAFDGTANREVVTIQAVVDGTVGTNSVPAALSVYTAKSGSNTEKFRLDGDGLITGTGTSLGAWTAYTPSIGGGWVLGNGTTAGRYCRIGKVVHFSARLVVGSTTTKETTLTISLPFTPVNAGQNINIPATFTDAGTAYYLAGALAYSGNSNAEVFAIGTDGQVKTITATVPFTWAANDVVYISGTYEIA